METTNLNTPDNLKAFPRRPSDETRIKQKLGPYSQPQLK